MLQSLMIFDRRFAIKTAVNVSERQQDIKHFVNEHLDLVNEDDWRSEVRLAGKGGGCASLDCANQWRTLLAMVRKERKDASDGQVRRA